MAAVPRPTPSDAARSAQILIAVILAGAAMVWLAPILTPLALAVFLMLMIDAMARDLQLRAPILGGGASLTVAIVLCILVFAVLVMTDKFIGSAGASYSRSGGRRRGGSIGATRRFVNCSNAYAIAMSRGSLHATPTNAAL